jgi:predicted enzyme related to lactoylglutathione lyase
MVYRALFAHEPAVTMPGTWAEFEFPDGTAFAIGKHENHPWQSGNTIMFAVPDVAEAIALVRSLGGQAAEMGESPVCHMSFAQDTEGNQFILHHRK